MPKFILDTSQDSRASCVWSDLDSFTQGYITAMFWTSVAPGVTTEEWQATDEHDEGSIPDDVGFNDLAPESLKVILHDCAEFQDTALGCGIEEEHATSEQAGHDFWLTRNGHGAGFWDRGLGAIGDKLTQIAKRFGEIDVYLSDDGKVYYD